MATLVDYPGKDVQQKAYFAESSTPHSPGILFIHDMWGLNDHTKSLVDRLCQEGFSVLAPNLYARKDYAVTDDYDTAAGLMSSLDTQYVHYDLSEAIKFLKNHPNVDAWNLGAIGFSMGGTIVLNTACSSSELKAAVSFYGKVPPPGTMNHAICPIQYHHGAKDDWVTAKDLAMLKMDHQKFGKPVDLISYPNVGHAFCDSTRPDAYTEEAATQAWSNAVSFLKKQLRQY